jgi:hypothetical protein
MKKSFGVAVALALLAGGIASKASAANCDSGEMIRFTQNAFAYETSYTNATYNSASGSVLSIVGHVAYFCTPMAALNPADPNKEYTFYVTSLVSGGTAHIPVGPTTFHETDYAGGTWEIHEGSPENAPVDGTMPSLPSGLVPSTFIDGPVILSGTFANFHTSISVQGANINGSFRADYTATGGLYYPQVGNAPALFQGNWCVTLKPTGCTPATYSAHPDGKWDTTPSVAVSKGTWGAIKNLYR